jgi:hypothetical protein
LLTTSSSTALDLKESIKLLQVIGAIKSKLSEFESKNVIDILDRLIQYEAEYGPIFQEALTKINNQSVTDLVSQWKELRTKLDDNKVKRLRSLSRTFHELSSSQPTLPKIVDWRILSVDENRTNAEERQIQFSLTAGAAASIDIEANASLPVLPADVAEPNIEKAVLRCGLKGEMLLGVELSASGGPMSIGVGGSASGKVEADFYFLDEQDARFGVAAAENIAALVACQNGSCSPIDVKRVQALINEENLFGMRFTAESKLQLKARVGIGQRFNHGDKVKAKFGIDIECSAIEEGLFDYLLLQHQSDAEDVVALQVKRSERDERTIGQSLHFEFDTSGLAKHLQEVMGDHFGEAKEAIDELSDLLPGSDFIRGKLETLIDEKFQHADTKKRITSLLGFTPGTTPEAVLRDKIIDAIEGKSEEWANSGEKALNAIVVEVTRVVPLLKELVPEIHEAITESIEAKRELLVAKMTEKVTSADGYKRLAKKLNKAGAAIPKTLSNLDKRIEEATSAARDLLNRIQRVVNKAESLLKTAAEKKITLNLFSQRKSISSQQLDLRFDVFPTRDGAQDAVNAILLGDMGRVMAILKDSASDSTTAPIKGVSGDYNAYEKLTTTRGGGVVFFDFNLGNKSIIDAEVDWRVDISGNISVVSRAEFKRTNEGRGESRTVRMIESCEMLFAAKTSTMTLGITASHEDDDLKVGEATAFLSGLVDRGLLPASAISGVDSLMAAQNDRSATKGRIDVGITFTREQIDALVSHVSSMRTLKPCVANIESSTGLPCALPSLSCLDEIKHPGCSRVLDTIAGVLSDVLSEQYDDDEMKRINLLVKAHGLINIQHAIKAMSQTSVDEYSKEWEYDSVRDELSQLFTTAIGHLRALYFLKYRSYSALSVYEMLAHMKAMLEVELSQDLVTEVIGWTPETIKAQQYRIGQVISNWWQWDREWKQPLFLSDEMRALNVALFETLVTLGQTTSGERPSVWATISLPDSASGALVTQRLVAG